MKVTFCSWDKPGQTSAQNVWLRNLLPELRLRGVESQVLFLTIGQPEECPTVQLLRGQGFKCPATANLGSTQQYVRWILKRLAEDPPDVFVPHNVLVAYYAGRWARDAHIPVVGVLHATDAYCAALCRHFGANGGYYPVSAFVAVSSRVREMADENGANERSVHRISCGVPVPRGRAAYPAGDFRLVYVGRLVEEAKRITGLARALCRAVREVHGVEAVIYGDGDARPSVEHILQREGCGLPIRLAGAMDNKRIQEHLQQCHALVLLSDYEGTPISVMEAMACGVVPICLRIPGGVQELVQDGVTGCLVADRSDGFVAAVRKLRNDAMLWQRLSTGAKAKIENEFSNDVCAAKWESLLQSLHRNAGPKGRIQIPYRLDLPPVLPEFESRDPRKPFYLQLPCLLRQRAQRAQWHMRRSITAFAEPVRFNYKMWQDLEPYGGLFTWLKGFVKSKRLRRLQRIHHFDEWHILPVEWRPCALEIANYVNSLVKTQGLRHVIEVGCGLGGILSRIEHAEPTGFDLDPKVIEAARRLHKGLRFEVGSFAAISDREIDVLILVNFCHVIPVDELSRVLLDMLRRNRVKYLIVDQVPSPHCHNWDSILPASYSRQWESRLFAFERRVLCYRRAVPESTILLGARPNSSYKVLSA